MEMPDEFWLSVRHVSSFKNVNEYNEYIEKQKTDYMKKDIIVKDITING